MWLCCHLWEIITGPSLSFPPPPFSSPNNHEKLHFNVRRRQRGVLSGSPADLQGLFLSLDKTTFNCISFKTWSNKCILTSAFLFFYFLSNSILHSLTSHQTGMFWKEEAWKTEGPWNQEGWVLRPSVKNRVVEENNDCNSVCHWERRKAESKWKCLRRQKTW